MIRSNLSTLFKLIMEFMVSSTDCRIWRRELQVRHCMMLSQIIGAKMGLGTELRARSPKNNTMMQWSYVKMSRTRLSITIDQQSTFWANMLLKMLLQIKTVTELFPLQPDIQNLSKLVGKWVQKVNKESPKEIKEIQLPADMVMEIAINNQGEAIALQAIKWKSTTIRLRVEDQPTELLLNLVMEERTSQDLPLTIEELLLFQGTLSHQHRGLIPDPHTKCQDTRINPRHTRDLNSNTVLIAEPKCTPQIMHTEIAFFQINLKSKEIDFVITLVTKSENYSKPNLNLPPLFPLCTRNK